MWSPDIRESFLDLCKLLGKPEHLPKERIGIRWLSMLDSCKTLDSIKETLTVFYFAWLPQADKDLYKEQIQAIFSTSGITPAVRQSIYEILRRRRGKNLSQLGKQRKLRIAWKLFDTRREMEFQLNCVLSILPMFQKFILMFQQSAPQIHKLHDSMVHVFTDFLSLFVRAENIRESAKDLSSLNLDDQSIFIPAKHIECGKTESLLNSVPTKDAKNMRERLLKTFICTAQYMQSKLPFNNSIIRLFSFLDPLAFGQTDTAIELKSLPEYFPTINSEGFNSEIMAMQSDCNIPTGQETALDQWWSHVFKLQKYTSVQRIVTACLSVFTGPKVESSFSLIITKSSSYLTISHYEAILAIKYKLLSLNTNTCKLYKRPDPIQSPVDHDLAFHMQTSYSKFRAAMRKRKEERLKKSRPCLIHLHHYCSPLKGEREKAVPVHSPIVPRGPNKTHDSASSPPPLTHL